MKTRALTLILFSLISLTTYAAIIFTAEGDESSYNQVRVLNQTSQENFRCQLVILNEDDSTKELYGIYELKEKGDSDSNTKRFKRGTRFWLQLPKDFPVEVSFSIEYKDYPMFDAIIIHLFDKDNEFSSEFE